MNKTLATLRRFFKAGAFSPEAFMVRAVLVAIVYALSCAFGLREYTTFLSGTSPNPDMSWQTVSTLGLIHLLIYFSFILLVPVFLITAALLAICNRWRRSNSERQKPLT